jgi:hypothetical protein
VSGQAEVVAEQVDELNNVLPDLLADVTVQQALELLATVRGARQQLATLEAIVERHAAQAMTDKRIEWSGGYAERRRGAKRKEWLHDDLAHAVTRASIVDPATGELPAEDVRRVVEQAVSGLMNACAPSYWRVGQLGQMGIDVDDYCHSEPGRTTVEVHLGSEEAAA